MNNSFTRYDFWHASDMQQFRCATEFFKLLDLFYILGSLNVIQRVIVGKYLVCNLKLYMHVYKVGLFWCNYETQQRGFGSSLYSDVPLFCSFLNHSHGNVISVSESIDSIFLWHLSEIAGSRFLRHFITHFPHYTESYPGILVHMSVL